MSDTQIVLLNQVGWLVNGCYVVGVECEDDIPIVYKSVPIYDLNIRPYQQPCAVCSKELIKPHCGVILYNTPSDSQPHYTVRMYKEARSKALQEFALGDNDLSFIERFKKERGIL